MRKILTLVCWLFCALVTPGLAVAAPEARVALVINQSAYTGSLNPLNGTKAEADMVASALTEVGFKVARYSNLKTEGLETALATFRRDLEAAGENAIGFVYYTGHGLADSVQGDNFLIGTDAKIETASDIAMYGVKLSRQIDALGYVRAKAIFFVVDACRDVPVLRTTKSVSKGLSVQRATSNMLIAFSTAAGDVATEGVYAPILADELKKPGRRATDVFNAVQTEVAKKTSLKQRPWNDNQIYDVVCFADCVRPEERVTKSDAARPEAVLDDDAITFQAAKSCNDFKIYLESFPKGRFVRIAQSRRDETCGGAPVIPAVTVKPDTGSSAPPVVNTAFSAAKDFGFGTVRDAAGLTALSKTVADLGAEAVTAALKNDNGLAITTLGFEYGTGDNGRKVDYKRAWRLYEVGQKKGEPVALHNMGVLLRDGLGVKANGPLAARYFEQSAIAGYGFGYYSLAGQYYSAIGIPQDLVKARQYYELAAAANVPEANRQLGTIYMYGYGTKIDYRKAYTYLEVAAAAGDSSAIVDMGYMHGNGLGRQKDEVKALEFYKRAADMGDADAMTNVGAHYRGGMAVAYDPVMARSYYKRGCEAGDPLGCAYLGYLVETAEGGPADRTEALRLYRIAARQFDDTGAKDYAVKQLQRLGEDW